MVNTSVVLLVVVIIAAKSSETGGCNTVIAGQPIRFVPDCGELPSGEPDGTLDGKRQSLITFHHKHLIGRKGHPSR